MSRPPHLGWCVSSRSRRIWRRDHSFSCNMGEFSTCTHEQALRYRVIVDMGNVDNYLFASRSLENYPVTPSSYPPPQISPHHLEPCVRLAACVSFLGKGKDIQYTNNDFLDVVQAASVASGYLPRFGELTADMHERSLACLGSVRGDLCQTPGPPRHHRQRLSTKRRHQGSRGLGSRLRARVRHGVCPFTVFTVMFAAKTIIAGALRLGLTDHKLETGSQTYTHTTRDHDWL